MSEPISRPDGPFGESKVILAKDQLPAVEPPAAGFIMQLFLIPLLIVSIIVGVWLLFGWMARSGNDPKRLVADLERINHSSWQQALTLANLLQDSRNSGIRRDTILAKRLADVLELHLNEGHMDDEHVQLRAYLCMAVGEFETADHLPVLTRAANKEDDPKEVSVRRAAVWGMRRIAEHQGAQAFAGNDDTMAALTRALGDGAGEPSPQPPTEQYLSRARLRSTAAYALGKIGTDNAKSLLVGCMTGDPYPDARYNAAAQLGLLGDVRALPTLMEMMEPENDQATRYEQSESAAKWKQQELLVQGMEATAALLKNNNTVARDGIQLAVQKILDAKIGGAVELRATDLMRRLQE